MELNIEQEKLDIVKKIIESNERYKGNEDLYEKFLDEIVQRGFIILNTLNLEDSAATVYLNKIVSSSIVYILEQEKRLDSIGNTFENIEETPEEKIQNTSYPENIENIEKTENIENKYHNIEIKYDFDYIPVISGAKIKPEILQKIYDTITISNSQNPEKEYLQIYNLRYIQKLPLSEISKKLNISEDIVSKNLYELMEKVREELE